VIESRDKPGRRRKQHPIAEDIAGIKLNRKYDLNAPKGVNGRNSDNTKIKEYLGWEPSIRLKEGLARTYAWIESEMMAVSRT